MSAPDYDAVIVGGGIAGLTAAWELTRAGLRPLVVEARGYAGGLIASAPIGGADMDLGAEGFVMRGAAVTGMVDELGLDVVGPSGGGPRLFLPPLDPGPEGSPRARWVLHRFLADSFLGIPARPLADDAVAVLGRPGAERAAADAAMPGHVGTGADDPADLASFVAARMGAGVVDRLVRPIVAGIHTADPADLAADTVAPGLRRATARLGSLQAGVAELIERRRALRRAGGSADVTVRGGMSHLIRALSGAIEAGGGRVLTRTGAQRLAPARGAGPGWELTVAATGRGPTPSAEPVPTGEHRVLRTRRLVLACSARAALRLLGGAPGVDTGVEVPAGSPILRVTLVVRAPGLAGEPVGSGLLVAPAAAGEVPPAGAKALSHLSVKWPWIGRELARRHGPGVHALRLSYGRPGEPYPRPDLARVLADAAALTGAVIDPRDVVDSRFVRWDGTLPPVTPAHRERTAGLLDQVEPLEGLEVTGAWVAGTGIASVVAHARARAALLGGSLSSTSTETGGNNHRDRRK